MPPPRAVAAASTRRLGRMVSRLAPGRTFLLFFLAMVATTTMATGAEPFEGRACAAVDQDQSRTTNSNSFMFEDRDTEPCFQPNSTMCPPSVCVAGHEITAKPHEVARCVLTTNNSSFTLEMMTNITVEKLELIEPYLFPEHGPAAGERFADALARRARS